MFGPLDNHFNENSVLYYSLITLQPNKNKGNIST